MRTTRRTRAPEQTRGTACLRRTHAGCNAAGPSFGGAWCSRRWRLSADPADKADPPHRRVARSQTAASPSAATRSQPRSPACCETSRRTCDPRHV